MRSQLIRFHGKNCQNLIFFILPGSLLCTKRFGQPLESSRPPGWGQGKRKLPRRVRLIFWLFSSASDNRDAYDIFAKGNFLRPQTSCAWQRSWLESSLHWFHPLSCQNLGSFYLREIRDYLWFFEIFIKSSTFLESEKKFFNRKNSLMATLSKFMIQLSVQWRIKTCPEHALSKRVFERQVLIL